MIFWNFPAVQHVVEESLSSAYIWHLYHAYRLKAQRTWT